METEFGMQSSEFRGWRARWWCPAVAVCLGLAAVGGVGQADEAAKPKGKAHVALRHVEDYGRKGGGVGEFLEPRDLAIDPSGNLLVADTRNHRIVKLNPKGTYLTEVGGFGWDDKQFNEPTGISAGSGLEVYVSDGQNQRISVYSQHLKLIAVVGGRDAQGALAMGRLGGITSTREGELYVTDVDLDQVIQISTFSRSDRSFGGYGYGSGELRAPSGIDVDEEGRVYVCDTKNDRVVVFDGYGNYDREIGVEVLSKPAGAAIGPRGVLFVSDTGSHRVLAFDLTTDEVVGRLGGPKPGSEAGRFHSPRGLAFGRGDHLFVADTGNHRISKFKTLVLRR